VEEPPRLRWLDKNGPTQRGSSRPDAWLKVMAQLEYAPRWPMCQTILRIARPSKASMAPLFLSSPRQNRSIEAVHFNSKRIPDAPLSQGAIIIRRRGNNAAAKIRSQPGQLPQCWDRLGRAF